MKKWLFLVLLGSFGSSAMAANSTGDLQKAMVLLEKGQPQQAYTLLSKNMNQSSKDAQEWFLLAMAAKESGRPAEEPISYLEKVLSIDPKSDRTKLELASLLYKQGDVDKAKRYFNEVKANNPPVAVGKNIDSFMADAAANSKSWQLRAYAGLMYDSNVNSGPSIDSVLIFGLPFQLSTDAKKTADSAWKAGISFDHVKKLGEKSSWQSNFAVNQTDYKKVDTLDTLTLAASTGLGWKLGDKTALNLPLVYEQAKVGHDKSYYYYSYGISPQLQHQPNEKTVLGIAGTASKRLYKDQNERNINAWSISPSVNYQLGKADSVGAGLVFGKEKSRLDIFSNRLASANVGYSHTFQNGVKGNTTYTYTDTKYEGVEPAYTEARHDKSDSLTASVTVPLKQLRSDINLSVSHTENASSLNIYDYNRDQVFISLQKQF